MLNSIPRASGIYQITCTPTGKMYIGSAVNLRQRKTDHFKTLRGCRHINVHLQRAWDKHGESAFTFTILELVPDRACLIEREQAWMDLTCCYDSNIGYNISSTAGSNSGVPRTAEWIEAHRQSRSHTIDGYIDPNGSDVVIHNLWDFCKRMGLKHSAMWRLARGVGRTKSHKGWTHRDHPYEGRAQVWSGFIDPHGNIVNPIYNLSEFCRQNKLSASHMQQVHAGKRPHHRGWTCNRG